MLFILSNYSNFRDNENFPKWCLFTIRENNGKCGHFWPLEATVLTWGLSHQNNNDKNNRSYWETKYHQKKKTLPRVRLKPAKI